MSLSAKLYKVAGLPIGQALTGLYLFNEGKDILGKTQDIGRKLSPEAMGGVLNSAIKAGQGSKTMKKNKFNPQATFEGVKSKIESPKLPKNPYEISYK